MVFMCKNINRGISHILHIPLSKCISKRHWSSLLSSCDITAPLLCDAFIVKYYRFGLIDDVDLIIHVIEKVLFMFPNTETESRESVLVTFILLKKGKSSH